GTTPTVDCQLDGRPFARVRDPSRMQTPAAASVRSIMRILGPVFLVACSSRAPAEPAPVAAAADARRAEPSAPKRWFAGDVAMPCRPPADPADVSLGVDAIAARARDAKLDFVVLTPHLWPGRRGARFDAQWREMAAAARRVSSPTLIPGIEWTTTAGH